MSHFLEFCAGRSLADPVLEAGLAHLWFLTIHPFDDGNGRIARAISDLMLARSEGTSQRAYSLSAQICAERRTYYEELEAAQKGSLDITRWLSYFLGVLERAFERAEGALATVLANPGSGKNTRQGRSTCGNERSSKGSFRDFEGKLTTSNGPSSPNARRTPPCAISKISCGGAFWSRNRRAAAAPAIRWRRNDTLRSWHSSAATSAAPIRGWRSGRAGRRPRRRVLISETLPSRDFPTFEDAVAAFLERHTPAVSRAGFGIAGPVVERNCQATNLPWVVDAALLEQRFGLVRVELLNDLEALAYGIAALGDGRSGGAASRGEEAAGQPRLDRRRHRPRTGRAFSTARSHRPFASEGGHADLAPRNEAEMQVLRFLLRPPRAGERRAGGVRARAWSRSTISCSKEAPPGRRPRSPPPSRTPRRPPSPTLPLREAARRPPRRSTSSSPSTPPKPATWRSRPWPAAASTSSGGIALKILTKLQEPAFREAFCAKGRMRPLLEAMPLKVILSGDAALYGVARGCWPDRGRISRLRRRFRLRWRSPRRCRPFRNWSAYIRSISLRFIFMVGVISPVSALKSRPRTK